MLFDDTAARVAPSGEKAREAANRDRLSRVLVIVRADTSHSLTLPSYAAVARVAPSGENATDAAGASPKLATICRVCTSQSPKRGSPAAATEVPTGAKARAETAPGSSSEPICRGES